MKHISDVFDKDSKTAEIEIIDPTEEAQMKFGGRYGCELLEVTEKEITALLEGKAWAFEVNGGEYSHFVVMKREQR